MVSRQREIVYIVKPHRGYEYDNCHEEPDDRLSIVHWTMTISYSWAPCVGYHTL